MRGEGCRQRHADPAAPNAGLSVAEQFGKYLTIEGVRFAYGHEQVLEALGSNAEYAAY